MRFPQIAQRLATSALAFGLFAVSSPLHAQPDFGDDSSRYANDGECDDPRFQGSGAANTRVESDRGHDATDCRTLYRSGEVTLVSVAETIDFGDDSSRYANDGECDDPRFEGAGSASSLSESDRSHDATDCRNLLAAGRVTLRSDSSASSRPSPPPAAEAASRDISELVNTNTGFATPEAAPPRVTGDDLKRDYWVMIRDALSDCGEGQTASRSACLDRVVGGLGATAIDHQDPQDGWTHLGLAAAKGDAALVEALVTHGANVNLAKNDGVTPLHLAIIGRSVAVVRFLVEHDADVDAKTDDGVSAMQMALAVDHEEIADIMREAGALY
jgi:ankyrin repeat protein